MKYHLIPIRITIVKKTNDNKCWQKCVENQTFVHY